MELTVAGSVVFCHTGGVDLDVSHPAVVMVPGAGQDHSYYRFLTRRLAHAGLAALAVDLPGHGKSRGPGMTSIEEMAVWLLAVLDAAGIERALLVGHSMGSFVAIETAAPAPERVTGLVLTGCADRMRVHPELQAAADAGDERAVHLIAGWTHSGTDRLGGHPQPGLWTRGVTERLVQDTLSTTLGSDLRACAAYDGAARAGSVRCPVTLVVGDADVMTPAASATRLAAAIPQARVVIVAGSGHNVIMDRPQAVVDEVLSAIVLPPVVAVP
jgi:pimeloyl-ACP methyl ester carboxylesterase